MKKLLFSLLFTSLSFISLGLVSPAFAGTNLQVTCANSGTCSIAPAATPLFNEQNLLPGDTRTQTLTIQNTNSTNTCDLVMTAVDSTPAQSVNLANRMFASISSSSVNYFGVAGSGFATSAKTYQNLYNAGSIALGTLSPNTSRVYTWYATFDQTAGNEFQNVQTRFNLNLNISCNAPTSNGGGGGGGNGGGNGTTTQANPPTCGDATPSSAPSLSITNIGNNTVTLRWTAVSPVTHYALFFTRNSDGEQYGASNIGNVTEYTITNLSGGAGYTFQVMGVNGCAPGPRSSSSNINNVPGGFIASRPLGNGGQVLGVTEEVTIDQIATPSPKPTPSPVGQVKGVSDEVCTDWRRFIPWILLVIQFILILFFEYKYRFESGWTKMYLIIGTTLLSIGLFYILRECNCTAQWSWILWLCKWYWIVAIGMTLLLRGFSYAFLDETTEKEQPPTPSKTQPKDESEKASS